MRMQTFENFVVGKSNEAAYALAKLVAERKSSYNPVMIYGRCGNGRTHLAKAMETELRKSGANAQVLGEFELTAWIVAGVKRQPDYTPAVMYQEFSALDVLIVEDIQMMAGKESLQQYFAELMKLFVENGKQVVLTSDMTLKKLSILNKRLFLQLQTAKCVKIREPEQEVKEQFLQMKASNHKILLSQETVKELCGYAESMRQLDSAWTNYYFRRSYIGDTNDC